MHSATTKNTAKFLRRQGKSLTSISTELKVSKSTLSLWLSDIELSDEQRNLLDKRPLSEWHINHRQKLKDIRDNYRMIGFNLAKTDDNFRVLCSLYWGEGTKATKNSFNFTNSDPTMIQVVFAWIQKSKFRNNLIFTVQYHSENISEDDLKRYWMTILPGLTPDHFRKFTALPSTNRKSGKLPYGTARLTIHRTELMQMVFGGIDFLKSQYADTSLIK